MGVTGLHWSHLEGQQESQFMCCISEDSGKGTVFMNTNILSYQIIKSSVQSCNQKYFSVSLHRIIVR